MRHRKSFNHLGRTSSHRKALLSNLANSLLLHKRITTTLAKAKELRQVVEPILTRAKTDTTENRREVFSLLQSKNVVAELFRDISQKIGNRQGGYTRILKTGNRLGDNAEMCIIELVDYNENMLGTATKETGKKRRSRSKAKKAPAETKPEVTSAEEKSVETAAEAKPVDNADESAEAKE